MKTRRYYPLLAATWLFLIPASGHAQSPAPAASKMTGTSHPELLPDDLSTAPTPPPAKVIQQADHYVPPASSATVVPPASAPQAIPAQTLAIRGAASPLVVTDDVNSGIVTEASFGPNELPAGTPIRGSLIGPLSTRETRAGAPFSATLSADVTRNGIVLIPAGSTVMGKVTLVHGGKAIGGPAAIRLQPRSVTLPDGTTYSIEAEVTDLDHVQGSHVNSEGTIVDNTHARATAVSLGLTTASAVVAGAVVGGGVGAVVGLAVGAGAGTIWWFKHDRQQTLPEGTEIVFTLSNNLLLTPASH